MVFEAQGRAYELVVQYQNVNPKDIHTENITWTDQLYLEIYMCIYIYTIYVIHIYMQEQLMQEEAINLREREGYMGEFRRRLEKRKMM